MIPAHVCAHFWPHLPRRCDAGLRALHDCPGCPAYSDALGGMVRDQKDRQRIEEWAAMRRYDKLSRAAANRSIDEMKHQQTHAAIAVTGTLEFRDADGNIIKAVPIRSAEAPAELADEQHLANNAENDHGVDLS